MIRNSSTRRSMRSTAPLTTVPLPFRVIYSQPYTRITRPIRLYHQAARPMVLTGTTINNKGRRPVWPCTVYPLPLLWHRLILSQDYSLCDHGLCLRVVHCGDSLRGAFSVEFCNLPANDFTQAIRAFRHPERYGPRRVDPANPDEVMYPQSRAKGLARAVLDTFPIVKFNLAEDEQRQKDEEARGMELSHWEVVDQPKTSDGSGGLEQKVTSEKPLPMEEGSSNGQLRRGTLRRTGTQSSRQNTDVTPQTIGRETCPICIVDFEEGDDLRVLPCEGKHRFHQACVDPWLLELSSSCPLCREGRQLV
jgi:hypothetical protein